MFSHFVGLPSTLLLEIPVFGLCWHHCGLQWTQWGGSLWVPLSFPWTIWHWYQSHPASVPQLHRTLCNGQTCILELFGSSESMNLRIHLSISLKNFYLWAWMIYLHICAAGKCLVSWRPEWMFDFPGLEFQKVVSWYMGCWGLNPCPLEEQSVSLAAEPSPQPFTCPFLKCRQAVLDKDFKSTDRLNLNNSHFSYNPWSFLQRLNLVFFTCLRWYFVAFRLCSMKSC